MAPAPQSNIEPASPSELAERLSLDATALELAEVPAGPAGDLAAEVSQFASIEACTRERALRMDPALRDALRAIGYEHIATDACRVLDAIKASDIERCRKVDSNPLRARCAAVYAMASAAPDLCPIDGIQLENELQPARARDRNELVRGRLPLCVAVANRDPTLCAAVPGYPERATCEAILTKSSSACKNLAANDRGNCELEAKRFQSLIQVLHVSPPVSDQRFALDLTGDGESLAPQDSHIEFAREVSRGVVLVKEGGTSYIEVGALLRDGGTAFAPTPASRTRVSFAVRVAAGTERGTVERLELEVPGRATMVVPGARFDGLLRVVSLGLSRGSLLQLDLQGTIGVAPNAFRMRLQLRTFVRDIVVRETGVRSQTDPRRADAGLILP
jgi:hypothetical protein